MNEPESLHDMTLDSIATRANTTTALLSDILSRASSHPSVPEAFLSKSTITGIVFEGGIEQCVCLLACLDDEDEDL
jgi:hypothetical protein